MVTEQKAPPIIIGPSTGWLNRKSLTNQLHIVGLSGANAIELAPNWSKYSEDNFFQEGNGTFSQFRYRSLHLPDLTRSNADYLISIAKTMQKRCGIQTAVLHPLHIDGKYPIWAYEAMMEAGVPLALENMDKRKTSGFEIQDLVSLLSQLKCGMAFDVQHAYEHDHNMSYAKDLFTATQDSIVHLHVSGETIDNRHERVCSARNPLAIEHFIKWALQESRRKIPIILEGTYTNSKDLREEIDFHRLHLMSSLATTV